MYPRQAITLGTAAIGVVLALATTVAKKEAPTGQVAVTNTMPTGKAIFSGGCFWGLQATYEAIPGVLHTRVGYVGGRTLNPDYAQVIAGDTGHAEAVEVTFDPQMVSFSDLVHFHLEHARTQEGEPPSDYPGKHFRSSVFVVNDSQRSTVDRILVETGERWTLNEPAGIFWQAEPEHQNYLSGCRL